MTKANECTCPSGDGSLRWPCPKHPAVEHERAEFEAWVRRDWPGAPLRFIRDALPVNDPRYGQYCDDALQRAWVGWQARAALAQPSPVRSSLLINGYQLRAALEFIAPDGTAKQLESEALIEWRQQDADFLEAGLYAWCAEYHEEGCVLLDEEPATAQPSPAQAEKAEVERPEVVGSLYLGGWADQEELEDNDVELDMKVVERLQVDLASKGDGVHMPLMTIAQHECIVGELRAVIAQLRQHKNDYMDSGQETYRALQNEIREREAEIARLDGLVSGRTAERDAALAEVERLTRDRDDCLKARLHYATQHGLSLARLAELTATRNRYGVDAHYFNKNLQRILRDFESFTPDELARSLIILAKVADEKVVAQAQHSVPEEFIGRLSEFLAQRGATGKALLRELRDMLAAAPARGQHSVPAYVSYTTRPAESLAGIALRQLKEESRWVEIRDINAPAFPDMQSHSYYPAGTVIKLPAAAPGKEVGHE
ncbi:TPA: LysM peptidoglycan-binding domain-containing protein [Pseudomonas aeruginosa]